MGAQNGVLASTVCLMEPNIMNTIVIKSETDYKCAATRIEALTNANPGTAEARELKVLVKAVADYHRNQK